ncbi:MAG: hypothetical protein SOW25_03820 [Helicobacter sp.]|nr:hypothetical protein [Helicobacteraceae bacterium]MDY3113439.1 hypothetical protein [Helicobacter sp.]
MRVLLIISLFTSFALCVPKVEFKNSCVPLSQFSKSQKEVLLRSYLSGEKDGFGLTLAAIAWKESCAGEYKMNFQDPSAGNFHAYIPGVIKRYPNLKQNGFTENLVGAMLVENDEFAAQIAIYELKFWQREHKGDWKKIIKSYNKGYSWQKSTSANKLAESYYSDIAWRVKQLESYFANNNLHKVALELPKKEIKKTQKQDNFDFYTYGENIINTNFSFLPIYEKEVKKTATKEFDLIEIY